MDLILVAVPFFFLFILLELAYGVLRGRNTYRINDTINSLSMGSLSRLSGLAVLGSAGLIYEWIAAHWRLSQLPADAWWVWVSCFLLYDFTYYWKHRLGHEVALFWASHVAHHQSEDFNLGTALRQSSVELHGFLFYLPFFVLGYPAETLFAIVSMNLIYQFWVHTEHVPGLGLLELILVTPSNHRVHHARNDNYVNKNYGGVFIVWDRLFGSYQAEARSDPPAFGLRKPLHSWNPLWANVHVYWHLCKSCWQAPGLVNKLRLLFKPPGWRLPGSERSCKLKRRGPELDSRFDPPISVFARRYTLLQFLISLGMSFALLLFAGQLSDSQTLILAVYLGFSFYVFGMWLEGRRTAAGMETLRLMALGLLLPVLSLQSWLNVVLICYAVTSLATVQITASQRQPLSAAS